MNETTDMPKYGDHFQAIKDKVKSVAPRLDDKGVIHAANLITNEIRKGFDCYGVDVGRKRLGDDGYYHHFEIETSGIILHVRLTVD